MCELANEIGLGEGDSKFVLAESYLCNGHSVDEGEGVGAASEEAEDGAWTLGEHCSHQYSKWSTRSQV